MTEVFSIERLGNSTIPINLVGFEKDAYEYDMVAEVAVGNNKSSETLEVASQSSDPFGSEESENESVDFEEHRGDDQETRVNRLINASFNIDETQRRTNPFDSVSSVDELPVVAIEEEVEIEAEEQVEIDTEEQVQTLAEPDGNVEFLVVTNIHEHTVTSLSEQQVTSLFEHSGLKISDTYDTDDTAPETSRVSSALNYEQDFEDSAKSLLKKAGERLEYQQRSDEIRILKGELQLMRRQAEDMSEQLRRSIDTKNDLVIAQQEIESYHESILRTKDTELDHHKAASRRLADKHAEAEVGFMNEISSLSKHLSSMERAHRSEIAEKDQKIDQLETHVRSLRAVLVRGKEIVYSWAWQSFSKPLFSIENDPQPVVPEPWRLA